MKLVKIEDKWINQEFVCAVYGNERFTEVELVNSDKPFGFKMPIEKVLQAIEGSQEHLIIEGDAAKKVVSKKKNHLR